MKKYFLLLFLIHQQVWPHQHELKVYRKKVSKLAVLAAVTCGVVSLGWLNIIRLALARISEKKTLQKEDLIFMTALSSPGLIGATGSAFAFNSLLTWHLKRNTPILIFDEEGFTYEKPMGLLRNRKYVRYFWKDVISHWVISLWAPGIIDYFDRELKRHWCYNIRGEKDIVKIDALELEIPDNLKAKIESLRQGKIRALWD